MSNEAIRQRPCDLRDNRAGDFGVDVRLLLCGREAMKALLKKHGLAFAVLVLFPLLVFLFVGIVMTGVLGDKGGDPSRRHLWMEPKR